MKAAIQAATRQAFAAMSSLGVQVTVTFYDSAEYNATTGEVYDAHRQLTICNAQRGQYNIRQVDGAHIKQGDFPLYVMVADLSGFQPKAGNLVEIGNDKFKVATVRTRAETLATIQLTQAT